MKQTGPTYKRIYCPELHKDALISSNDLVIDCIECSFKFDKKIRYWFNKVTREEFEALP